MGVELVFSWREVGAREGFMGVTQMQHYVRACSILKKFIGRTRVQLLKNNKNTDSLGGKIVPHICQGLCRILILHTSIVVSSSCAMKFLKICHVKDLENLSDV